MNHFIVRVSAVVVGVLIGLGITLGLFLLPKNEGDAVSTRVNRLEESIPNEAVASTPKKTTSKASEPLTVPDQIIDLAIPNSLFDQKKAIASWTTILDENKVLDWLEQSTLATWNVPIQFREEFQAALVQKFARTSPAQALEFATARIEPVRSSLGSIVFFVWATNDLAGAIAHAKTAQTLSELDRYWVLHSILQSQDGATREQQREIARELGDEGYAITFYFQSLLATKIEDPKKLWYEIVEQAIPDNFQHIDTLEFVAKAWIDEAGLETFDEISASFTDKSLLEWVAPRVLWDLAEVEGQTERVFEYTLNLHDDFPQKGFILRSMIGRWARADYKAVLTRAESLPPSNYRQDMLSEGYREKANIEPKFTLQNLDSLPLGLQDSVGQTAVRALTQQSPTEAVNVVLQIDDEKLKRELATTLVYTWSRSDLDATKNWILSMSTEEPLRDTLLAPLANTLIETDPRLAFELALQQSLQPNGEKLIGYETNVLRRITQTDIDLAIELLPRVREESRVSSIKSVAGILIDSGDSRKAILLVNDLSETEQIDYFQNSAWNWIKKDSEGLKNNLENIELAETRSHVALGMIGLNTHTKAYDDQELQSIEKHLTDSHREMLKQLDAESQP